MPSHPIDFLVNPNTYSTPELRRIFDEKTRYQRWLDFESALARVQGELGVIPRTAADEIVSKAKLDQLDLDAVRQAYATSRNSLMPLISGFRKACHEKHGEYIHYGVTTQDVLDTAQILEVKDTMLVIYRDLRVLEKICLDLAKTHRNTPIVARTHGQQALPITFGLKAVIWLNEIRRHIERLKTLFPTVTFGQLSGAVGTMAALGPKAMKIAARTLKTLGLRHSKVPWHNSRDTMGELSSYFSLLVSTLGKMVNEIFQLQKNEFGELKEPLPEGTVASTTMPHKANPVICQRVGVLARHVRHLHGIILESLAHEHERDARSLWAEWLAIPQLCIYTGTALHFTVGVMAKLEVHSDRMLKNLHLQKAKIASEWVLFRLGPVLGKMKSLERLHELSNKATEDGISLKETLTADPEIGPLLTPEDLSYLDHPEKYIGHTLEIVDFALAEVEEKRKRDPEILSV